MSPGPDYPGEDAHAIAASQRLSVLSFALLVALLAVGG
jgi:hypothetical protein